MSTSPTSQSRTRDLPEMGEVLEGRYRLEQVIGRGGMGIVVKAHHLQLERPVAIKLMHRHLVKDEGFVERFKREVLIAKQIEHPNTVRIYDSGINDSGAIYLVMEYLEGVELKEIIANGPMPFDEAHSLATQILDGLAEAHHINVVHRDLKPGNVFVCLSRRGRRVAKLLDFGIAKSLGEAQQTLTATGAMMGTGPYLAPELFMEVDYTKSADIYACGLLFFEMLTGRRLMGAQSIAQSMARHLHMPVILPQPLATHPVGAILLRALAKSPTDRFSDADEMLAALQECRDACDKTRLTPEEVDDAFTQMQAAFVRRAGDLMPGMNLQPAGAGPVDIATADIEPLDSQSIALPDTPTAANLVTASVAHLSSVETRPAAVEDSDEFSPGLSPVKPRRTRAPLFIAAGVLALILLAALGWYALGSPDDSAPAETPKTIVERSPTTAPKPQQIGSENEATAAPNTTVRPENSGENSAQAPKDTPEPEPTPPIEEPAKKTPPNPPKSSPKKKATPPQKPVSRPRPAPKKTSPKESKSPDDNPFEDILRRRL